MNTALVTHRLNVACIKAMEKETERLIREREITREEGLELDLMRITQFDKDAVVEAYNCDSLEEVEQYIKEDYEINYDVTN